MAFSERELLARLIECEAGGEGVLLRSIESGNLLYGDIYSIKFVVIAERPYRPDHHFQV